MNETVAVAIWLTSMAAFIVVVVYWFNRSCQNDCFKESNDYMIDDFYTKGKP